MKTVCPGCGTENSDPGRDFHCKKCRAPVKSVHAEFVEDEDDAGPLATLGMSDEPMWKAVIIMLQRVARLAAMVLLAIVMLLCIVALLQGIPQVYSGAPESSLGATLYLLAPAPVGFAYLAGSSFLVYYTLIVIGILASLAYLVYSERRELKTQLATSVKRFQPPPRTSERGFVQFPQLFLAVFFFDIVYALLVEASGNTPSAPPFDEMPGWYLYYTFANASVYEEIVARTLLLGLPLLVGYAIAYAAGARAQGAGGKEPSGLEGYLRTRTTRGFVGYIVGGGFRIGALEAFFITGSSLMFGLAHVAGWDLWKILPTFIAGLAFGYLWLKVGIHAAIILHFAFDYLSLAQSLVPGYTELSILLFIFWIIVGGFYFTHYCFQIMHWLRARISPPGSPAVAPVRTGSPPP